MKRIPHKSFARQKGFSVVELMIAGILGLVLLGGVIQLFIGSNKTYSMQDELATLQENGRFAMLFLEDQIQMGGWTFAPLSKPVDAINIATSEDGSNDKIVVRRETSAGGLDIDCNGATVAGGEVINEFYVADGELMCLGSGSAVPQPLLSNVESFQVLYGVESDVCQDGVVNSYMNRDSIDAAGLSTKIMSVRVAILLHSEKDVLPENKETTFQILDVEYNPGSDRLARRLFQQTVYMPNAGYGIANAPDSTFGCMQPTT